MRESLPGNKVFRIRITLEMTGWAQMRNFPGAVLYGLLAAAYGREAGQKDELPIGFRPEAPANWCVSLKPGDHYAFNVTVIATGAVEATHKVLTVERGLRKVGREQPSQPKILGGNFRVCGVDDLVARNTVNPDRLMLPIHSDHFDSEVRRLAGRHQLTLGFVTPLRWLRPGSARRPHHRYFDGEYFGPDLFLERIQDRLKSLGMIDDLVPASSLTGTMRVVESRLEWHDFSYFSYELRSWKSLGGVVGSITFDIADPRIFRLLVMGQYVRVGESTRMCLGVYRVKELGPDPHGVV